MEQMKVECADVKLSNTYKTVKWSLPVLPDGADWDETEITYVTVWGNGNSNLDYWVSGQNLQVGLITVQPDRTAHVNIYLTQNGINNSLYGVLIKYSTQAGSKTLYLLDGGMATNVT